MAAMQIVRIVQTCWACPSQWEGFMADGQVFYIRFRHGNISVYVDPMDPLKDDAPIIDERYVSPYGCEGCMGYAELRRFLSSRGIETPEQMESENTFHPSIVPAFRQAGR